MPIPSVSTRSAADDSMGPKFDTNYLKAKRGPFRREAVSPSLLNDHGFGL